MQGGLGPNNYLGERIVKFNEKVVEKFFAPECSGSGCHNKATHQVVINKTPINGYYCLFSSCKEEVINDLFREKEKQLKTEARNTQRGGWYRIVRQ